jgi:hypothetical protein
MIIDVHAYIGKWPYWPVPHADASEVVGILDQRQIDVAAISSTRALFTSWRDGNTESLSAAKNHPGRLVAFAVVGPPELSHKLNANPFDIDAAGAVAGLRLYPQYHTYHLLHEPFIDKVCEQAASRQLPIQLPLRVAMNWGMPMLELSWITSIVERHPRVPWILSGLNYFHELRVGLSLLRRYPDVHLETSCIQGFDAIPKVVEECGSERILFGTGLPIQNAAAGISKIQHARISDSERDAILSGNARRLLKLGK